MIFFYELERSMVVGTFEEVIAFLKKYVELETGAVKEESQLKADLGLDSLTLVSIADDAEQQFGIVIEDEELVSIRTIGDIVRIIEKNR